MVFLGIVLLILYVVSKIFLTSQVNIQLNTETKFEKSVNGKLNIGSTKI